MGTSLEGVEDPEEVGGNLRKNVTPT